MITARYEFEVSAPDEEALSEKMQRLYVAFSHIAKVTGQRPNRLSVLTSDEEAK